MTKEKSKTKALSTEQKYRRTRALRKTKKKGALIVLITGSREMDNYSYMDTVLRGYNIGGIVHGDAKGADTFAQEWADRNDVLTQRHPVTDAQ